ncbi:MAG: LacI family DNA-binding transcriptional regulator [Roseiflexaceae bacterium]
MGEKKSGARRGPTMDDVARAAGVNRVTVSMALRGTREGTRNGTRISEATRQRILQVARDLGYSRSAIAMAFRRQRTDLIGFYSGYNLVLDAHLPFFASVINGLRQGCSAHQLDLLLYGDFTRKSTNEIYEALSSGQIDGLVVLPTPTNPVIPRLVRSHLAAVAIANPVAELPSVLVDEAAGSRMQVEYLASKGYRRVMYRADPVLHVSPSLRRQAFLEAADAAGIEVVLTAPDGLTDMLSPRELALLTGPAAQRPSAAVCWADMSAYRLLDECLRLGMRVPEDLAIMGFDGIPTAIPPQRRLTTIRAPWQNLTATAVELLVGLIDGESAPPETVLPVELVAGDTA